MRRRWVWLAGAAVLFALTVPAVRWWAAEYVYAPRLESDDPRAVVTAYFEAQRWEPGDVFLAGGLTIRGPHDIPAWSEYDEAVQFTVEYHSRWRSATGERPGLRVWFVYLGRNESGPWRVLGQGTGP